MRPQGVANAKKVAGAIAMIGAMALIVAWIFQYGFDIQPCELCLLQRYSHYVAVILSLILIRAAASGVRQSVLFSGLTILAQGRVGIDQI
jgi:disulfide bond formation protein DsbB